jgi:pantetheine-phosphate adenylyltransferase
LRREDRDGTTQERGGLPVLRPCCHAPAMGMFQELVTFLSGLPNGHLQFVGSDRRLCPRRMTCHAVRMIAVYAGRFDPVTNGHLDIVRRASRIFDRVIIAVYDAPADKMLFPTSQRVAMLKTSVQEMPSVDVEEFDGLLTDFARNRGADAIVRGLRAVTDFSVEFDQALMYKDMAPEIEQVYLMSDLRFVFVRATRIREVARLGHDVSHLVPEPVAAALQEIWPLKS